MGCSSMRRTTPRRRSPQTRTGATTGRVPSHSPRSLRRAEYAGMAGIPVAELSLPRGPVGAPNVVLLLLDDVGFGASEVFGDPVSTPAVARLAPAGLRDTRFHATAICSPTRASLL